MYNRYLIYLCSSKNEIKHMWHRNTTEDTHKWFKIQNKKVVIPLNVHSYYKNLAYSSVIINMNRHFVKVYYFVKVIFFSCLWVSQSSHNMPGEEIKWLANLCFNV